MSRSTFQLSRKTFHPFFAVILSTVVLATATSPSVASQQEATLSGAPDLSRTTTLEPNGTLRGYAEADATLFRLDLPVPGIITVDVMTPRVEQNSARLEILGASDAVVFERSATHLRLGVRAPGSLWVRATTRESGRYKIVTRFAEARDGGCPSPGDPWAKTDPETVDPDPDTPLLPPIGPTGEDRMAEGFCGRPSPDDPWTKTDPETVDPDPDTPLLPPIGPTGEDRMAEGPRVLWGACGRTVVEDDHGDTLACASSLTIGRGVVGELGNLWGDDVDVFAVVLLEAATLELKLGGDVGAEGTFHDRTGQRLAADDGSEGRAATLAPGRYYVRVEGAGVTGAYDLKVTARR